MREDKVLAMLAPKKTGVSLFQLAGNIISHFYVHGCVGTELMREDKLLAMLAPKKTGVSLFQLAGNINSRFYVHGCTGTQGACSTLKGKHKNHHHQTRSDQLMDYYYKNGGFLDSRNVFDEMKSWDLMSLELNHNCDCAA